MDYLDKPVIKTKHGEFRYDTADVANPSDYIPNGAFNPNRVKPYLIHNEYGVLAIVYASHLQDALDEAVDSDKLDSCLVSVEDYNEAEKDGHADEFVFLGNAGEPFDLTYIGIIELPNIQYGQTEEA